MKILPKGKWAVVRISICFLILFYFFGLPIVYSSLYEPEEGDVLFQSLSRSSDLIRAIEGVTQSDYSHCGVVIHIDGKWYVNEALGTVNSTQLKEWIKRGRGSKIDIYRLRKEHQNHIPAFIQSLDKYQDLPYDIRYRMDDDFIYCSELVYKAWKDATGEELGKLEKLGDLNWRPYEETIVKYEGDDPPLDRWMITPVSLSKATQLEKIPLL
jgi:hypothetical protein